MTKPALHTAGPRRGLPARRPAALDKTQAAGARAQGTAGTTILGLFAIPLGIAGLGGVWQALRTTLGAPAWPAEALFGVSTGIWIALTVAYLARGIRRSGSFTADRKHPIYGPFAAYIPIIGILIFSHYEQYLRSPARGAVLVCVAALAVVAAQLLAHWLCGNLPQAAVHPGYFLPAVAGAFIASIGLSFSGWHHASESAFGIGVFFWLIIGALIFGRLFGAPLPDALKPTLSVLVSAPATAGIAWVLIAGGRLDAGEYVLLGILFMMLAVQVVFFGEYRKLAFTTNFWTFTFPVAASANLIIRWLTAEAFPLWRVWSWTLAGISTAFVITVAAATVADWRGNQATVIAASAPDPDGPD
jgi:tellurite resistance protein